MPLRRLAPLLLPLLMLALLTGCGNRRDMLAKRWVLLEIDGHQLTAQQTEQLTKRAYYLDFDADSTFSGKLPMGTYQGRWAINPDGSMFQLHHTQSTDFLSLGIDVLTEEQLILVNKPTDPHLKLTFEPATPAAP